MIKNIIFDVGDVLIGYRWKEMLLDHGIPDEIAQRIGENIFSDSIWKKFDSGLVSIEELQEHYIRLYPEDEEHIRYFLNSGELMHVERPRVWERVHALKEKGYHIYLLSNYSQVLFEKHTNGASFLQDLDGGIISYQVHIVKPDPAIYQTLLQKYDLNPSECIFYDDRKENTDAAKECGIEAVTVLSEQFLLDRLSLL